MSLSTPSVSESSPAGIKPGERRISVRRIVELLVIGLGAIVAEWVTHATSGYVRADIVVLTIVFAETASWVPRLFAVAVSAVTVLAFDGPEPSSLLRLAFAVAIAAAGAWVLRRGGAVSRLQHATPSTRFAVALAALALIVVVGTFLQMMVFEPPAQLFDAESFWVRYLRRFVPIFAAVMVAGAVWSRGFGSRIPRWLGRLALAFIIVALTAIVPFVTSLYWANQERDVLDGAAATVANSLSAGLDSDLNAYLARAGQAPRAPFNNQAGFASVNNPLLVGNSSISALALLQAEGDGFVVQYEIDRQGNTPSLASVLGGAPGDREAINKSAASGVPVLLGIREVPQADGVRAPHLVYVMPQQSAVLGAAPEMLVAAFSIPVNMSEAISAVGPDAGNIHFTLEKSATSSVATQFDSLGFGPPARQNAVGVQAPEPINFGDLSVEVTATAAEGLGTPRTQQALTLLAEVLLGIVALLLFLQVANNRFRVQRSLEERESLLAAAMDSAPGVLLLIDSSRRVLMTNARLNDDSREVGHEVRDALPFPTSRGSTDDVDAVIGVALGGAAGVVEHVDSESGPTPRIYEVSATPVSHRKGVPAAALVQAVDVTDVRAQAVRAAQGERLEALGSMAGGLAHDFNNLLFIINGYLQLLHSDERIRTQADLERYVEHAGDAAERGAEIAKSLLAVTRSQPANAVSVNLGTFLQGIVPLARQALGPDREVNLRVESGDLDVMVDSGQLSSSVLNLVINARDAMGPTGSVLMRAQRVQLAEDETDAPAGSYVSVSVQDHGPGMAADVRARAFEPFFTTKPVGKGSGLGLAGVYTFARQCGGTAIIDSIPGQGTTVSILIPAAPVGTAKAAATGAAMAGAPASSRVLVVDDEAALGSLVAGWLSERGLEVRVANSYASALSLAAEFEPDTLLTDMNLGTERDGVDVAASLTAANPDLVVVFMTGFSDRMHELQQRGMVTLAKPFGQQDLYRVLFAEESARGEVPSSVGASTDGGAHVTEH